MDNFIDKFMVIKVNLKSDMQMVYNVTIGNSAISSVENFQHLYQSDFNLIQHTIT